MIRPIEALLNLLWPRGANCLVCGDPRRADPETGGCPACMEEMSVQFLVAEGMKRLEDGGSLELEGELKYLLADSKRALSRHRLFWRIGLGLEFGAVIVMLVMLVVYLI